MKPRTPGRILLDVLQTLIRREWRQRLAQGRWLTVWALFEPLVQIFAVGLLYAAYGRATVAGQEAQLFLGVGIFGFIAFRNLATKPSDAVAVSSGLLTYRQVHVLDLILAKWGAEAVTYVLLGACGLAYMALAEDSLEVHAGGLLLAVFTLLSISWGITCALAWARKRRPWITTYFRPVFFAMYITSGALHPVWDLPEWLTQLLAYNPMVLNVELMRQSLLYRYESPLHPSTAYLLVWSMAALAGGTWLVMRHAEELRAR